MLVFNEGVPRAGKSYDAVKNHILPALKKGRRVFARLNGLRHDKIARYLDLPEKDVRELLVCVDTKDVLNAFCCTRDEEDGKWLIPDEFKDALVVIDEVHEFYVNERKPLRPEIENFWALLGQNGGDAVIMTQWINRLHSAVKARIEKKHSFQKLTAVGMKSKYRVTYWHTVSAGKFEKVGGQTLKYDPAIFPLYDGYAPGAENTEVYEEGGRNVWLAMLPRVVIFGVLGLVGAYFFVSFFFQGKDKEHDKPAKAAVAAPAATGAVGRTFKPGEAVPAPGQAQAAKEKPDPLADLTDEQRYVAQLADKARIRLSVIASVGEKVRAWVEWVDPSNNTIEQLDLDQLRGLGYVVEVASYGIRLSAGKHVLVATQWPRVGPVREQEARLYNTSEAGLPAGGGAGAGSVATGGGADAGGTSTRYGSAVISAGSSPQEGDASEAAGRGASQWRTAGG